MLTPACYACAVRGFAPMKASHNTTMNSPKWSGNAGFLTVSIYAENATAATLETT